MRREGANVAFCEKRFAIVANPSRIGAKAREPETPMAKRTGILLVNLGTPDAPTERDVRRYLREFLGDPYVIDLPAPLRWLLLNLIILPRRPRASAALYASIWTAQGSPLLVHSRALAHAVAAALGDEFQVELAMRYGNPSLESAFERLAKHELAHWIVMPLYPQETGSSSGSTLAKVRELAARFGVGSKLSCVNAFYARPEFSAALGAVSRPALERFAADHVLFSFHGVPERHVLKEDASRRTCLARTDCCDTIRTENAHCYRAQCFATARTLAKTLALPEHAYSVGFQSRLGRTPWIQPYTDERLAKLAAAGHKRLAVICPSFVADCLETLEEIGIRAHEHWQALGGDDLLCVPCLNAHPAWVATVATLLREQAAQALSDAASRPQNR